MSPNYRQGEKVQVYTAEQQIIRIIAEVRPKGKTWEYSLLDPDTGKLCYVNLGDGGSKVDWQEERWLRPFR